MRVHFITSRETIDNDITTLRKIIDLLKEKGHSLAVDWIDKAHDRQRNGDATLADWRDIYKKNVEAIAQSDVVIAETSYENFGVGYQVAMAVQQKKPVLLLRHAGASKNAFVTGVEDGWVKHEEYEGDHFDEPIAKFISDNTIDTKDMRFNFFIDRPIYNYLRWAALKTGKTKAEILRELVQREIKEKDY